MLHLDLLFFPIKLYDYIDKRERLRTSEERQRLLREIPPVVADTCQIEPNTNSPRNSLAEKKGWLINYVHIVIILNKLQ